MLRSHISISIDGYVAGPNQDHDKPLGVGGLRLHEWMFATDSFHELHQGTTFTFVTDGIESALAQGRTAAAGQDVMVAGGAQAIQQYLAPGLLDELYLHIVPVVLGAGERPLENVGDPTLEPVEVHASPAVTHVRYRVVH